MLHDRVRQGQGDVSSLRRVRSSCGIVSLYTWSVWRHVFGNLHDWVPKVEDPDPLAEAMRVEVRRAELACLGLPGGDAAVEGPTVARPSSAWRLAHHARR